MLLAVSLLLAVAAFAADSTQYTALRAQYPPTDLSAGTTSIQGLPTGATFEVLGFVRGVNKSAGTFSMIANGGQLLYFTQTPPDPDIVPDAALRVLGRVRHAGGMNDSISVTRIDGKTPPAPPAAPSAPQIPEEPKAAPPSDTTPTVPDVQAEPAKVPAPDTKPAPAPTPKPSTPVKPVKRVPTPTKKAPATKATPSFAQQLTTFSKLIRRSNRGIDEATAEKIAYGVLKKSPRYGIDPRLVFALLARESNFNTRAISPMGALGLGQLMPGTAQGLGVIDPFDIFQNIEGTVQYLAAQLNRFNGNVSYALAAYNAGPGNVLRFGGIPPFQETQNYVRLINVRYQQLTGIL
jgi:hypothetical protein